MISVIICSANKIILEEAVLNIKSTIEIEHEIIVLENYHSQTGICEAYNKGAKKAKFNVLCFMHEDIAFETKGWGINVCKHLMNPALGLIGIAGGDTKSLVPSSWSSSIFESEISLVQHFKTKLHEKIIKTGYPEDNSVCKPVTCIDGVWMCTRKDVFEKYQFDENIFTKFHGYDIDYSLQVLNTYQVAVVFDVLLHHYSEGSFNRPWLESTILISKKWRRQLPVSVRQLSRKEYIRQHWTSMNVFIDKMIALRYNRLFILGQLLSYSINRHFNIFHFLYSLKKAFSSISASEKKFKK